MRSPFLLRVVLPPPSPPPPRPRPRPRLIFWCRFLQKQHVRADGGPGDLLVLVPVDRDHHQCRPEGEPRMTAVIVSVTTALTAARINKLFLLLLVLVAVFLSPFCFPTREEGGVEFAFKPTIQPCHPIARNKHKHRTRKCVKTNPYLCVCVCVLVFFLTPVQYRGDNAVVFLIQTVVCV